MIENMIKALIPGMLLKIADIPREQKQLFAGFLDALLLAYLQERRSDFDILLSKLDYPEDWKTRLTEALWK